MADDLKKLVEIAKSVKTTRDDNEKQRRSFAYGNTRIENPIITREMVDQQAENLKRGPK